MSAVLMLMKELRILFTGEISKLSTCVCREAVKEEVHLDSALGPPACDEPVVRACPGPSEVTWMPSLASVYPARSACARLEPHWERSSALWRGAPPLSRRR